MFRNLLPKEHSFYEFFESHTKLCKEAAAEFYHLTQNYQDLEKSSKKIKSLERQMDDITLKCTEALLQTFITPFERSDIHKLIQKLDDIGDGINAVVSRFDLYNIKVLKPEVIKLAELIYQSVSEVDSVIHLIRNMKNADMIKNKCDLIRKLEKDTDEVYKESVRALFDTGVVMDVIKWKEIYDRLEKVVDRTQQVSNIIESIIITAA